MVQLLTTNMQTALQTGPPPRLQLDNDPELLLDTNVRLDLVCLHVIVRGICSNFDRAEDIPNQSAT
jgi:hypothetical protein